MIQVENLSKIYKVYEKPSDRLIETFFFKKIRHKEFHAIRNLSFEVSGGETIGIIGRNGSGKSTLLKILSGVLNPTGGKISINGKVSAILELGAGFNQEYTGIENIFFNGILQGKSKKEMQQKLDDILAFADIGDFIHQPVKTYSSGMFARLAFAVAINVDPDILIVDEALAVGDMKFQAKCFKKFEELKSKGITILFVGHDVSSIRKFCDRTLWLNNGELIAFGDTLSVTAEYMEYMNSGTELDNIKIQTDSVQKDDSEETRPSNSKQESLFEDALNRWGSHPELIQDVQIINEKGLETNTILHGEVVRVKINFFLPDDIDMSSFSVAISMKNTMGLDLLVYTTHDNKDERLNFVKGINHLYFEFVNYFAEVDLILVTALENRASIQPEYYDYIEGAHFLKSIVDDQIFGIFHPPVRNYLRK